MNNNDELTNVMANAPNGHNKDWGNYKFINIANTINNHLVNLLKRKFI